jgi:hypothetical protein
MNRLAVLHLKAKPVVHPIGYFQVKPKRHRRADAVYGYSICPKVETRGESSSGAL